MQLNTPFLVPSLIGLRYASAGRRNGYISFVSLFAFAGMALGVFALIVVLSVMNGFDRELKERILRVVAHGSIEDSRGLEDWRDLQERIAPTSGLEGSAPFVDGKALLHYRKNVKAVEIQAVLPEQERQVSIVDQYVLIGRLDALQPGAYGIVLGSLVARSLGIALGDKITVTLPQVSVTPAGIFPRTKRFTVVGVFEVGAQVDQYLALIHLADGQKLFRTGGNVDGLRLKFNDIYAAPQQLQALEQQLGPDYKTRDWSETQGSLFQAVKMEKTVVGLMLSIVIAVAAFNIVTSLIMMVAEKRSDIAVLRTLGMTRGDIVHIFIVQGLVIGVLGVLIGAALGVVTALWLPEIVGALERLSGVQIFDPDIYFVPYLPSLWRLDDTLVVTLGAIVVALLATLYPAYRASTIEPAEALRYDT